MTLRATARRQLPLPDRTRGGHLAHVPTALAVALLAAAGIAPTAALAASQPGDAAAVTDQPPSVLYEEAVAHAQDRIAFAAGGRVTVPFSPRAADRWAIDGVRPV